MNKGDLLPPYGTYIASYTGQNQYGFAQEA